MSLPASRRPPKPRPVACNDQAGAAVQPDNQGRTGAAVGEGVKPLCAIVVQGDVGRCCDNRTRGMHWAQRGALFSAFRSVARWSWEMAGKPRAAGQVRASFLVRRWRVMDVANIAGALKPTIDGLFVDAITPDDGPKYLLIGEIQQETGKQWRGREEVIVTVEEVE